jgi:hypothetical protein
MLDAITKKQIKDYVIDYLKARIPDFVQSSQKGLFTCPKCKQLSANIYPQKSGIVHCFTPDCQGKIGDIFDLCRQIDFQGQDLNDEDIADMLIEELGIKTDKRIDEFLQKYTSWGWSLVPVSPNKNGFKGKEANIEQEWEKKTHKDINEWMTWLESGLNIGRHEGEISNTTTIDIDTKSVPEEIKKYIGETLTQTTNKGTHLSYIYEPELPSVNLRFQPCKLPIEVRNSQGWQTVIFPSIVEGKERSFNDLAPIKMPEELKQWLLSKIVNKEEPVPETPTNLKINESDFTFEKLNGNRNNSFLQFGGILRKYYSIKDVERIMTLVNNGFIDKALPVKEIKAMVRELGKYGSADANLLTKQITDYLTRHEEASARDLVECLKMERKDIQEGLANLIQENKVYKQKSLYKIVKDIDWRNTFIDDIKTLSYKIPYFSDYAVFREGDQIIVGGNPGTGKTHLAMNFVKSFVDQGLQNIYYYGTESKSRYLKIALELNLKEGDFYWATGYEPSKIELRDNAITILDWLDVEDFASTAQVFKLLQKQLDKHLGILIVMCQLNTNETFYAENQLKFYGSLVAKYLFTKANGIVDTQNTYLKVEKVRESKTGQQYFTIPTKFNPDTKIVELRKA